MQTDTLPREDEETALPQVRDEEGSLNGAYLAAVSEAIETSNAERLRVLIGDLHESDLGDVLQALSREEREALIALMGGDFDWTALTEVDETVRDEILETIPNTAIAEAVRELDSDDAIGILEDLADEDREEILAALPLAERIKLERSFDYPEESAGRRMTTRFIAVPPFWTVGQTIDFLREDDRLPDDFTEVFVVDPRFCFLGTVSLDRLLRTKRPVRIEEIMGEVTHSVSATDDQEEVARLFERYNLLSVGVVDESDRLVGVITIDDIVDVIEEEADEDIKRLAGVGDEELTDTFVSAVRSRFIWLLLNLGTALLASAVIGLFDGTISQMVALAVLMPIVASMGGNAGTQTMTVAVRALATRDIETINPIRFISREALVGLANGVLFAIIIGVVASLWFSSTQLGGIIAVAMIINMVAAGLAGILIPLALEKAGADPAIASSVFVTTVTDVVGFFAFLGLAAWWFAIS
ncbi:magnesium transporter [Afifella marina]|uniref:Magnesium transporter MgtE n=1 Tax=Afifella marina DSM 2698 TaxID=1120955 RepID=A0A1G5NJG3_AFIMA|nr:magnesium transporter [Afifella marina]MBK1623537.1 magnesium transporter [Afifella marina DSM 2698]MBK1626530.1 magnesium transporter [Afifella marina]MBK5916079.1 magnesium transporter [Afifella marina]RAI21716.1 magnesium transporter [Afifella marina DSM 2698]SCZ37048.1 magnesium transporter [Afifella marina DSM 2698]